MTAASTSKPKAMTWDEYADIVEAEWQVVLNDPACSEHKIQSFLEDHPCMLPGYDAFDNAVRREGLPPGPIYEAVFSQPRLLPGRKSYVPDFMWLPTDSQKQWVVLIEIENPLNHGFARTDSRPNTSLRPQARSTIGWGRLINRKTR